MVKNLPVNAGDEGSISGQEDSLSRKWQPTSVFLPGKFHGQRSLVGYSPCGHTESNMTEHTCTCMLMSLSHNHFLCAMFLLSTTFLNLWETELGFHVLYPYPIPSRVMSTQ